MAASLFTEEDQLAAVSAAAGGYERGQEKEEGREEVARFPGIAVGSASELESQPILARYTLSYRKSFRLPRDISDTARKRLSSLIEPVFRPQLPAAPLTALSR